MEIDSQQIPTFTKHELNAPVHDPVLNITLRQGF